MRIDKLTTKFQEALSEAQTLALGNDHSNIDPLHLLLGRAVSMAFYMHGDQVIPPILSTHGQGKAVVNLKRCILAQWLPTEVTQAILPLYNPSSQLGRDVPPLRAQQTL